MPKLAIPDIPVGEGGIYPGDLANIIQGRQKQALGDAGGLTQFGVNLTRLPPGKASAHRHWHAHEDEFFYIISGEGVLVEDNAEIPLKAGDAACFPAGVPNGHHIINRSNYDLVVLEIGTRSNNEIVTYTDPEVDMKVIRQEGAWQVLHKNGTPY